MAMFSQIEALEERGCGRVVVFGASNLEIDLLPPLYDVLRARGRSERLCVVIQCRGGEVNAARRIALLLHEFTDHLMFVVPYFCESAGTVMALAARTIVAGPLAIFSPIDPHLSAENGGGTASPSALSAQDIRQFWRMSRDWFGLDESEAKASALPLLCDNIFPTTLTSFHRCALELEQIGDELLSLHMPARPEVERAHIVQTLLYGFHSHTYALTRDDLRRIGLPIESDPALELVAWELVSELRRCIGPESRESLDGEWHDALIATRDGAIRRRRRPNAPAGAWEPIEQMP
jgi:Serine dehydrogenase proteinase